MSCRCTRGSAAAWLHAVLLCSIVTLACNRATTPDQRAQAVRSSPDLAAGEALLPVAMPDLSTLSASAQVQLRKAYDALSAARASGAATRDQADAYGMLGKLLLATDHRQLAVVCFRNAQALDPGRFDWSYYLGHAFYGGGDVVQAAGAFERASSISPDDVPLLVWRGRVELDQGRTAQAQQHFERARSLQPRLPAALLGLGQVALARQDYAGAVRLLEEAASADSRAGAIQYALALAYRGVGDTAKAEARFRQQNNLRLEMPDPLMDELDTLLETSMAYQLRGSQALDRGEWGAAVELFRRGIVLAPDEPSLHHKLATALSMSGERAAAVRQFEEVTRRWPQFARGHYSLGLIAASSGQLDEALERFRRASRLDPFDIQSQLQLAQTLRATRRCGAARKEYARAGELDPRLAEVAFGDAMALVCLGKHLEARDSLLNAARTFPGHPGFAHAAARLLAAAPDSSVRDGRLALQMLQQIAAGGRMSLTLAESLAMAFAENGQYQDALRWQYEAITAARTAGDGHRVQQMTEQLSEYERRRPRRTPWGDEFWTLTLLF